jgi:outer membrane protein
MAARAQLRSTDEQVPLAQSGWRPVVTASANAGRGQYFINFSPTTPYQTVHAVGDYGVTVTENLYRGNKDSALLSQAEKTVEAGRAELRQNEQKVLLAAAQAYLDVARDDAVRALSVNNEQVLTRDLDMTRARYRVGELTSTDVAQAEDRLSQAVASRVAAEGALQASRATFADIIGRPPEGAATPNGLPSVPATLDDAKSTAQVDSPEVVAADWAAQAAEDGVEAVRAELRPSVSLQGVYSRNINEFIYGVETRQVQGMLNVTVPLYEAGGTYARMRAQKQTWGQKRIQADQARRDAIENATQSWEGLAAAHSRTEAYTAQIAASELALNGVKEESKVGARTIIEVLNAELELFQAKVNRVTARRDEGLAAYQLRAAVGQLTAQALNLPVDVYDPVQHYREVDGKWIGGGD